MDCIRDGWFSERCDLWPGQSFAMQVEKVLHHEKTPYQDIVVLQTKSHGRALILDGIIQCTEHDEFSYQESITFLPLCAHENPKKVLIVGGGDGGVAREVVKHPLVEKVVQVEIDGGVIAASKKFLPFMACGFESPKLELLICDGFKYMREHVAEFDVIITDSSDPIGPAINLFTESYFGLLKTALKPNGIICSQASSYWIDIEHVKSVMAHAKHHFANVRYASVTVPTYPTGSIGFVIATADSAVDLAAPKHVFNDDTLKKLRFYNEALHRAAFVLPNFAKEFLS